MGMRLMTLLAPRAVWQDFRYGLRSLRREAGWTAFAVAIIGLGIGASATVFSVVNSLLLRPLPFDDPGRLVWIANGTSENLSAQTVQVANLIELQRQGQSFAQVAGFSPFYGVGDIRLTGSGEPARLTGVPVTEGFFPLLGVKPLLGRLFTADESGWGVAKTVVIGHALWLRRFHGDPGVIGQSLALDGTPATVIGVLPASFDFSGTFTPGRPADLFYPFPLSPETNRRGNTLALIGRLKPGADLKAAQAEATVIGERLDTGRAEARRNRLRPYLSTLRDRVSGRFEQALLVLASAVASLMLIVCANVSNLVLVRASARRRELAVRVALGAERPVLIRQLLIESITLSCAGATLGLVLAWGATALIAGLDRTTLPLLHDVRLDGVAVAFTVLTAILTGIAFGVWPALRASAVSPNSTLKDTGRGSLGGGDGWLRRAIVVGEIAMVCALLTGAGLLTRSLVSVLDVDPGFTTANVFSVRVDPARTRSTLELKNAYFDELVRSVRATPGIDEIGLTDALPLGDNLGWRTWGAAVSGADRTAKPVETLVRMVDEGYLATMQISLRAGRRFTAADDASNEPVIIVNESLARTLWPDQDPLGRMVRTNNRDRRVVGVVGEVSYFALDRQSGAEMYMPIRQTGDYELIDLVIRSSLPAASLMPGVRAALRRVDPTLPAAEFQTMERLVDRSVFAKRFIVLLIAGFAGFGLILATLGIYAVISYSVSMRTQEIGIRLALGASPQQLATRVFTETMQLALMGILIGIPLSWMAARAIQGLLFGIAPWDPMTFGLVLVVLAGVAGIAGYLPATRAARTDPLTALRAD